jgi:hypothetical protein
LARVEPKVERKDKPQPQSEALSRIRGVTSEAMRTLRKKPYPQHRTSSRT